MMRQVLAAAAALLLFAGCVTEDENRKREEKPITGPATGAVEHVVVKVLSGDTVQLDTGEVVRYAGIQAPRSGEDFFEEARLANERLVFGKDVRVRIQFVGKARDEAKRRFVHLYTPGKTIKLMTWVNAELLEGGWCRLDYRALLPRFEQRFEEREAAARAARRGIWKTRG